MDMYTSTYVCLGRDWEIAAGPRQHNIGYESRGIHHHISLYSDSTLFI